MRLPGDAIIVMEQRAREFSGGIEISPIDACLLVGAIRHILLERRIQRCQQLEIGRLLCILVTRMHFSNSSRFSLDFFSLRFANMIVAGSNYPHMHSGVDNNPANSISMPTLTLLLTTHPCHIAIPDELWASLMSLKIAQFLEKNLRILWVHFHDTT